MSRVYQPRSTNGRKRSSKAEMLEFRQAIFDVAAGVRPATIRHIYYRLVAAGVIDKTEHEYDRTKRMLGHMRRDWWAYRGSRAARAIADTVLTAAPDKPVTDTALALVMREVFGLNVPDALTLATCVPFAWIADNTRWTRKPETWASLEAALTNTARTYRRALWDDADAYVEIYFERVAVTPSQIEQWDLPTKPPKKTDSRSRAFEGGTVEIEALHPEDLRALVRKCIERHVDHHQLEVLEAAEQSERELLLEIAGRAS